MATVVWFYKKHSKRKGMSSTASAPILIVLAATTENTPSTKRVPIHPWWVVKPSEKENQSQSLRSLFPSFLNVSALKYFDGSTIHAQLLYRGILFWGALFQHFGNKRNHRSGLLGMIEIIGGSITLSKGPFLETLQVKQPSKHA